MSTPKLDLDASGNIITKPVTGWNTVSIAKLGAVLVVIEYLDGPGEPEKGDRKQIQLLLKPNKCQELGDALKIAGKSLGAQAGPIH